MEIKVLTAHSYPIVRQGIFHLLKKDPSLALVGQTSDVDSTLRSIRRLHPNVGLVESFAEKGGLRICDDVNAHGLSTRILLLASEPNGEDVYHAIAAGAAGYLTPQEPLDGILSAIENSLLGGVSISIDAQTALQNYLKRRETTDLEAASPRPLLSCREINILRRLAEGLSIAETAQLMHLSPSTVKNQRQSIFVKLSVPNAPAAVYKAVQIGLFQ